MAKKRVNGKVVDINFRNSGTKSAFLKLCDLSPKVTVDWDTFRAKDKFGLFQDFTNAQLSLKFRHLNLRRNGVCWYCSKTKMEQPNGLCNACAEQYYDIQKASKGKTHVA